MLSPNGSGEKIAKIARLLLRQCCDYRMFLLMEPASTIIKLCGGIPQVAAMVARSELRVRRWTYPRERGGTDGLIPTDCQQTLLDSARAQGIDLRPEHFFQSVSALPAQDEAAP